MIDPIVSSPHTRNNLNVHIFSTLRCKNSHCSLYVTYNLKKSPDNYRYHLLLHYPFQEILNDPIINNKHSQKQKS